MKAQLYTGWFETENGIVEFSERAINLADLWTQLVLIDKHEDFGHTDMEITDEEGNDVTMTAYNLVEKANLILKNAKELNNDDT